MSRKKVLVVCAGPGGLAASMLLANAGVDVEVYEQKPYVGGRTSTLELDGGYRFDLGPTFFLYTRVLEEIYRTVGRDFREEVEMVRLDPQYRLLFGAGGQIDATGDIERMSAEIAAISPQDKD